MSIGFKTAKMLARMNDTVQVGKDAETRKNQAKKAFKVVKTVEEKVIYLIIDDVWTTGASIGAAAIKLREAGAETVLAGVLAVGN